MESSEEVQGMVPGVEAVKGQDSSFQNCPLHFFFFQNCPLQILITMEAKKVKGGIKTTNYKPVRTLGIAGLGTFQK